MKRQVLEGCLPMVPSFEVHLYETCS